MGRERAFLRCSKVRRRTVKNEGQASGLVYVAWPLQKDNGFVRDSEGWRRNRDGFRKP